MKAYYSLFLLLFALAFTSACSDSDNCTGVVCDTGSSCVNGTCVIVDKCEGVKCDTDQSCVNGACVPKVDKCATVKCAKDFVCVEGACVPVIDKCATVKCAKDFVCVEGACVPVIDKCKDVTCTFGFACIEGACVDKCATVKCAQDFVCIDGACVPNSTDKCKDVTCKFGFSCIEGECVDKCAMVKCAKDFVCIDGACVPEGTDKCANVQCLKGFDCVEGNCIDRCISMRCGLGTVCIAGECVPNPIDKCKDIKCPKGSACAEGLCVFDIPLDPCEGMICVGMATCDQGICVTPEMKKIEDLTACDPETFIDFCDGKRTVYCDKGIVASGTCDEGCVVYEETFFGRPKRRSGCIDGGKCKVPNVLERSCSVSEGTSVVFAKACQLTTRGTLSWLSVDGYYCSGSCDAANEKCALQGKECDPYDYVSSCDRQTLSYCHLDSNLMAEERTRYCDEACVSVANQKTCGYACKEIGARKNRCQTVNVSGKFEQTDYICSIGDGGTLYSVWTGQYELCVDGCDNSLGTCK